MEGKKISIITIIKEVKEIYPKNIAMIKMGNFYQVYGRDAYIVAYLFKYKIKEEKNIVTVGFPSQSIKKIEASLESKKINYMVLDRKDSYSINEKMEFNNLNTYDYQYNSSKVYVNNQKRIKKINDYLEENSEKEELKNLLKDIEEVINARGKI